VKLTQVVHIQEVTGARGGKAWLLTLACGHVEARKQPPIHPGQRVLRNHWKAQRAPDRVRCWLCENKGNDSREELDP
jgi:hypothetical protein